MQKNLLIALAGAACISFLSSCGTETKKEEAPKVEQTAAPTEAPKSEEGKEVAQAPAVEGQEAATQVAQNEATQTVASTDAPAANEQKA